jgi:zinc transport system permease protein
LKGNAKIKGDAATALLCSGSLAIGVMVISLTTGMNTDVCNYMFGSILAMSPADLKISVGLCILVVILFVLFFQRIFAVTFDETFAEATGTNVGLYNMVLAALTAVTCGGNGKDCRCGWPHRCFFFFFLYF